VAPRRRGSRRVGAPLADVSSAPARSRGIRTR
jgi:hypothetical protein